MLIPSHTHVSASISGTATLHVPERQGVRKETVPLKHRSILVTILEKAVTKWKAKTLHVSRTLSAWGA
jgi:hypothetical protein